MNFLSIDQLFDELLGTFADEISRRLDHRERERAPVVDVIWGDWFF